MMNPRYHFQKMKDHVEADFVSSRERSLALTKIDEAELWLTRCEPTDEAKLRDTSNG